MKRIVYNLKRSGNLSGSLLLLAGRAVLAFILTMHFMRIVPVSSSVYWGIARKEAAEWKAESG
jgi:hypothetical protein